MIISGDRLIRVCRTSKCVFLSNLTVILSMYDFFYRYITKEINKDTQLVSCWTSIIGIGIVMSVTSMPCTFELNVQQQI